MSGDFKKTALPGAPAGTLLQGTIYNIKVTVYLQGCLAYKRCSASGLNCSYLNPHIKLKLIGLAIKLNQKF